MPRILAALFFVACAAPDALEQSRDELSAQRMTARDFERKPTVDLTKALPPKGRSMGMLGGQEGEPGAPPPVDGANTPGPADPDMPPPVDEEKPGAEDDDEFSDADVDGDGLIDEPEDPAVDTGDSGDSGDKED